ncbi:MAG: hypothetical protein CENE_03021 [Candidatus Celerinatantimonas neptuna]|nr:MAG: hypothetical protein CENE_03021 [Candidatus Celerinatantimonas neptuna]
MKACQSGDKQACAQKTKELVAYEKTVDEEDIDAEYPQYNLGGYSLLGIDKALGKQLTSVSNIGKDATGVVKHFVLKRNSRQGAVKSVLDTGGAVLAGAAVVGGCVATGVIPCLIGATAGGLGAFNSANYLYGDAQQAWTGKAHSTALISTAKWLGASSSDAARYQRYADIATAGTAALDLGLGAASLVKLTRVRDEFSGVAAGSQTERLNVVTKKTTVLNWNAWEKPKANSDAVPDMSVSSSGRQESGQNADTLLLTPTRESVRSDLDNLPDGQGENHTVRQLSNGKFTTVRKDIHLSHPIKVTDEGKLYAPLKQVVKSWQSAEVELKYPGIDRLPESTAKAGNRVTKKIPIHHVCTNKNCISTVRGGPWTPRFNEIFKKADLDLDDFVNKVAVPGHKGPHPEEYHSYVHKELMSATRGLKPNTDVYRKVVTGTLKRIKTEATTTDSQVNKWLTKK